jgi:hypothetical protein
MGIPLRISMALNSIDKEDARRRARAVRISAAE